MSSFKNRNADIAYVTTHGANMLGRMKREKKALLGVYAESMVTIQS